MINFLMIMKIAVCTLGSITLQDKKLKIKKLPIFVCTKFDKHFVFIFGAKSLLNRNIQYHENRTFLFCLSIYVIVCSTAKSKESMDWGRYLNTIYITLCVYFPALCING